MEKIYEYFAGDEWIVYYFNIRCHCRIFYDLS